MATKGKKGAPGTGIFKTTTFMGRDVTFEEASAVIVPVPYATTAYTVGTKDAPNEIMLNWNMEDYDLRLGYSPSDAGIYPLPEREYEGKEGFEMINKLAGELFRMEKFPVFLGGDQGLTIATTKAAAAQYKDLTVIFFDAHADMKDVFEDRKDANMCVVKRVGEFAKTVQIGVRSIGSEEVESIEDKDAFESITDKELNEVLRRAGKNVYISIDVDVFDPSLMPATPMPEQDGMIWSDMIDIIKKIVDKKNIVGCDICELSPIHGMNAPSTLCAQLAYKIIGMKFAKKEKE